MDNMYALQTTTTGHDGVFLVSEKAVTKYIDKYQPQMLRHDKRARTYGCVALNFGVAKGLEFQRVLVVPTTPIRQYLTTGNISHIEKARDKLHVAVTRARHSVAFVYDNESPVVTSRWNVNDH
jgi:DNA helicase-2/ATP-dependent DNA helicase PcrA